MSEMGLVVVGAAGRMGQALIRAINETAGARLAGAVERPGSPEMLDQLSFLPPGSGHDVKPEYSVAYEAGARYTRGNTRFELIGFVNDYSNLTDVCSLASGCLTTNLDRQLDAGAAQTDDIQADNARPARGGDVVLTASYSTSNPLD